METRSDEQLAHLNQLSTAISRLVEEWAQVCLVLGIPAGAPWSKFSSELDADRGTSQRLARIARQPHAQPEDLLPHVPGLGAWRSVLHSAERSLGEDHPRIARLAKAIDVFERSLGAFGGSKAAAERSMASRDEPPAVVGDPRRSLVAAAEAVFGYSVGTRFNIQIVRRSPEDAGRMDVALVNVFQACRGRQDALPFALERYGLGPSGTLESASPRARFHLLPSVTSSPPPEVLSTATDTRQTVFIEPVWTERSIDVGLLVEQPLALPTRLSRERETMGLTIINRHPTYRLIAQTLLEPAIAEGTTPSLSAYRAPTGGDSDSRWFDRIPEAAPLITSDSPRALGPAIPSDLKRLYGPLLEDIANRLQWPIHTYTATVATIDAPVPLARYTTDFTPH